MLYVLKISAGPKYPFWQSGISISTRATWTSKVPAWTGWWSPGEPRAKFQGTGTSNGTNVCNFDVDAWAGSFTGNVDAFGLKISCSTGGDRYSLPATVVSKGSIIIHK
jgi:hypothetical protein